MTRQDLVLIPGLVCDAEVWRHQVEHLAEHADIIVAPADTGETIDAMAGTILDAAPDSFALAGFSMGGYVAIEMLRQAPERIARLALLDTNARPDTPEKTAGRETAIARCEAGDLAGVIDGMMSVLLHPDRRQGELAEFVRIMADRVGPEVFALRHRMMMTRRDGREILPGAKVPVRAICGRQDGMSSVEEHEEIAALAPNGRFSLIEDCGHMTILERPQAATALLRDWLLYG